MASGKFGFWLAVLVVYAAIPARAELIGVVGAGPAGMEVVRKLTQAGMEVMLIERTPYVGGNVAHGYFYTKDYASKLAEFRGIASRPNVRFFGDIKVGAEGDLTLDELSELNLDALVFTSGARPRSLGIPGEELAIASTRIFYYYNGHPEYPTAPKIGRRVAIIGSGSSAIDVTKYLLKQDRNAVYYVLVRRGPGQYGHKYPGYLNTNLSAALDREAYERDVRRHEPELKAVGENVETYLERYLGYTGNHMEYGPDAGSVQMIHLVSPVRVVSDGKGNVTGLEVEENRLVKRNGKTEAEGTGKRYVLDVDTVVVSAGSSVDDSMGLPISDGRVRTMNFEDLAIQRDTDVKDSDAYFASRTLNHYRVDFRGAPEAPPFPVYVAGWARLPGVGASDEVNRFSNIPDGRALANLLIKNFAGPKPAAKLEPESRKLFRKLWRKGCVPMLSALVEPHKRARLTP